MRQQISCTQRAIGFLSRRSHFERELELKLRKRAYDPAEISETLDRLRGEGLIDDHKTAREFIRTRMARAPEGRMKLRSELTKRGVDGDLAEEALAELLPEDDQDLTQEAAERWLRRSPRARSEAQSGTMSDRDQAALARHLARRGFSRRAIFSVLRKLREATGPDGFSTHDDPFP